MAFKSVQATFHGGTSEALLKTIDGKDASPDGWCVTPQLGQMQSVFFVAETPVDVDLLNLTMFFMSGQPNASFADFSVHYTSDPDPSFDSVWEDLPILNYGATYYRLGKVPGKGPGNRLLAAEEPSWHWDDSRKSVLDNGTDLWQGDHRLSNQRLSGSAVIHCRPGRCCHGHLDMEILC